MKIRLIAILVLVLAGLFVFYQRAAFAETVTLQGTVIDNICANANKADLANFIKTHTKSCALMSSCEASGYALYSGGKLYQFDAASNKKVADFLKQDTSKLDVTVKADVSGTTLNLISIENRK